MLIGGQRNVEKKLTHLPTDIEKLAFQAKAALKF